MTRLSLFIGLLICSVGLFAQQTGEQLAGQYFGNKEYDKAAELYEPLNNKNPGSVYIYDNLLQCYFYLKQFDNAEKLVKKQQRRFTDNYFFKVDQGYVYKQAGNKEKAEKHFDELLKGIKGMEYQASGLSNAFQKRGETDRAIQVYIVSRKLNGNNSGIFAIELAQLYGQKHETRLVVEEYMNALQANPMILEDVEDYLQIYLDESQEYDILKSALIKRYKENQHIEVYSELLTWLYVQRKDFENALLQVKALDKRNKEDGRRIYELATIAMQNESYEAAGNIYQTVLQLGKDKPFYLPSMMGLLDARTKKITYTGNYTAADLKQLETAYEQFLNEEGRSPFTASAIREQARLEAGYLNNYDKSIALYQSLLDMSRLDSRFKAECKLELGDIYVLKNEVWDAVLLYGQVDKDFLEEPIGQEAKFRNARLSYYLGEFEWAKAQLDILKTATSQLIANNALELSLLIQDNTQDSIDGPLLMFAKADLNYYQKNNTVALQLLDSIQLIYPHHTLDDDILFKRAQIYERNNDIQKCVTTLELLLKEHGTEILGDNALFMLADVTEHKLHDKQKAMALYEQFIEQYPGSFFLTEVRKRFRNLRGDILN